MADLDFGKDLFEDRLYEEAINEFEKIIAESPTSNEAQEAIFYIGESYRERKQFARAENSYRKLIEGYPGNIFREKVLHYLVLVQYEQAKYKEAIKTCEQMLNKYPLSKFTKSSLSLYLQSIYDIGEYNRVIVKGRKLVKNYGDYNNIPDSQLIIAKAFFAANIPEEGRKTLNNIISEYPDHDARWKAIELEIELLEKSNGITEAAEKLAQKISQDVPRHFEESLRLKLAEYYYELKKYDLAYLELEKLINKFDSSEDLDKYIVFYSSCQLKLNKFSEIIEDHSNFKKVFRESPLKAEYLLNLARAYFMLNDSEKAKKIIEDTRAATTKDINIFECDKLNADILLKNGQLTNAIESYKKLLYSPFARTDELLFMLGDIYVEYFSQYTTAIKFYQRIITGYSTPEYYNKAYYKIALCYENMNMYNEAISELEQINPDEIADAEFRNKIEHKKRYLKEFKQQDYKTAFNKLVGSLAEFFENEDKNLLQEDLIDIMSSDLKEYEKATGLINLKNNLKGYYQRAKLFLINAEKKKAETKYNQAEEYMQKANLAISKLDKNKLLVTSHSYNSFQKDQIESLSSYLDCVYVLVRYNPIAEISRYIPVPALDNFKLDSKIDITNKPSNVNVYPTPILYAPIDSQYKKLGEKHFKVVEKLIKKNDITFDFIHSHFVWSAGYVGAKLKEKYNVPSVVTAHGHDIYDYPFRDREWKEKIEYVLNAADYVITVSDSNLECIKKLNVKTPVKVIPNGFSSDLFHQRDLEKCRKVLDAPLDKKIVLSVGHLFEVKGHKYLIEAMREVVKHRKDVLCIIVGEGKLKNKLEKQIKKAGLENYVKLADGRPHNEIPIWLNACDVFVLPSLNEGNPTVMFEAFGCGKPFVGTKVGGIPEIITSDDYGLLAEPANPKELAEKILTALDKEWDNEKIRYYAERFTWENIVEEILDVYTQVLR